MAQADSASIADTALANAGGGTYDPNPRSTPGFGPREQHDETRQAQQQNANDAISDVNMNHVVAREQALTFTIAGQSFQSNQDLRQKIADSKFGKMA